MNYTRKVRAKEKAVRHFGRYGPVTEGKIYDFPDITFDDGRQTNLNSMEEVWLEEFEFINEIAYELY